MPVPKLSVLETFDCICTPPPKFSKGFQIKARHASRFGLVKLLSETEVLLPWQQPLDDTSAILGLQANCNTCFKLLQNMYL